ncbi:MAG: M20/M25/M40 family metallo-hydrolase [candidate division KSB1 bacterium]|nr:M20/M25/M40 family metallo-hydrolase [candidate division KSB1 bacterium]MDZ7303123.1 M20/M25/M40 family metallo-hydrolase [candidate division KSB1 bacterium]MDZ7310104.1 M20/M25/M40 family metallo-hydrolase [candidate division KSB1 bacterium]
MILQRLPRWGSIAPALLLPLLFSTLMHAQANHAIRKPYTEVAGEIIRTALAEGQAYRLLAELTKLGPRLSGSPQAAAAVEWSRHAMQRLGFQNVRLQEIMVPHWERGPIEEAAIINSNIVGTVPLTVCALGGSIATPEMGIVAEVVEVKSFEELKALGKKAEGKIIFFNRPMDPTRINTFEGYGSAVSQRSGGAVEAAKVGGVAVLVRSLTTRLDDVPHTGSTHYQDGVPKVPAAAISTMDANLLSQLLAQEKTVCVRLKLTCQTFPDAPSANVIGEIVGSEKPEEIILVGGHLDSWDKGTGAHDDGAGCVQSLEALRLLQQLNRKPKRTIRAVLFMNEENGLRGGEAYAREAATSKEKHLAAIEADRGGFAPRGFSVDADSARFALIARWAYLFEEIDADKITKGGGGADISMLMKQGVPGIGLVPEIQRYFDYHHSDNDTIDAVNERELNLGAAALAILCYVLAQEGL